jgi:hypothetical protein
MRFLARIETADPSPGAVAPPVESESQPGAARKEARTIPHSELRKVGRMVEDSSLDLDSPLIAYFP